VQYYIATYEKILLKILTWIGLLGEDPYTWPPPYTIEDDDRAAIERKKL
jgi:hypothetical protein